MLQSHMLLYRSKKNFAHMVKFLASISIPGSHFSFFDMPQLRKIPFAYIYLAAARTPRSVFFPLLQHEICQPTSQPASRLVGWFCATCKIEKNGTEIEKIEGPLKPAEGGDRAS